MSILGLCVLIFLLFSFTNVLLSFGEVIKQKEQQEKKLKNNLKKTKLVNLKKYLELFTLAEKSDNLKNTFPWDFIITNDKTETKISFTNSTGEFKYYVFPKSKENYEEHDFFIELDKSLGKELNFYFKDKIEIPKEKEKENESFTFDMLMSNMSNIFKK